MTRIENGIRKYFALASSTVFSDWHVPGEFEIEAVAEPADERGSQRITRERWRFRMGQDGILILTPRMQLPGE